MSSDRKSTRLPRYNHRRPRDDKSPGDSRSERNIRGSNPNQSRRDSSSRYQSRTNLNKRNMIDYKKEQVTPMKNGNNRSNSLPRRPSKRTRYHEASQERSRYEDSDLKAENRRLLRITKDLKKKADLKQQTIIILINP